MFFVLFTIFYTLVMVVLWNASKVSIYLEKPVFIITLQYSIFGPLLRDPKSKVQLTVFQEIIGFRYLLSSAVADILCMVQVIVICEEDFSSGNESILTKNF